MSQTWTVSQAIQEDPEDDTRLIFADWLEEQSDPALVVRGEFLRLQCRLAAWIPDLKDTHRGPGPASVNCWAGIMPPGLLGRSRVTSPRYAGFGACPTSPSPPGTSLRRD